MKTETLTATSVNQVCGQTTLDAMITIGTHDDHVSVTLGAGPFNVFAEGRNVDDLDTWVKDMREILGLVYGPGKSWPSKAADNNALILKNIVVRHLEAAGLGVNVVTSREYKGPT